MILSSSSTSIVSIDNSSNCFASTAVGASVIKHDASLTLGNAITSRMLSSPVICITSLSSPYASPACGGTPYLNASNKNPNCS